MNGLIVLPHEGRTGGVGGSLKPLEVKTESMLLMDSADCHQHDARFPEAEVLLSP